MVARLFKRPDLRPEDVDSLLKLGKIEELVRQNRAPIQIGRIGEVGGEMKPLFIVPPQGYRPSKFEYLTCTNGTYVFVLKNGEKKHGINFTLTNEQALQTNSRVIAERSRLNATNAAVK